MSTGLYPGHANEEPICPECGGPASQNSGGIADYDRENGGKWYCRTCQSRFDEPTWREFSPDDLGDPEAVIEALGATHALTIFRLTAEPMTAKEIANEGVPIATAHRHLPTMAEAGILYECGTTISESGRRATQYKRAFDTIELAADGMDVTVTGDNP